MIYLKFMDAKTSVEKLSTQVVRPLTIGKGKIADVQLDDDKYISRLHALVVPRPDGRLEVRDLSSTTGTFIDERGNRRRLIWQGGQGGAAHGRATLAVGESFYVGSYRVKVEYEEVLGETTIQPDYTKESEEDITGIGKLEE